MNSPSTVTELADQENNFQLREKRLSEYKAKLQAYRETLLAEVQTDQGKDLLAIIEELFPLVDDLLSSRNSTGFVNLRVAEHDITARKKDEEEREQLLLDLEKERNLWQATVDSMLDPVTVCDAQGQAIYMNKTYEGLLQMEIRQGLEMEKHSDYYQIFHPDGTPFASHDLPLQKAALENKKIHNLEIVQHSASGKKYYLIWNAAPINNAEGSVIGAVAVGRDITAQRAAESEQNRLFEENQRQKELLEKIFAVGPFGIAVISGSDFTIQMANPTYRDLTPHPDIDPVGKKFEEVWKPDEDFRFVPLLSQIVQNDESTRNFKLDKIFPDRSRRIYSFHFQPLLHAEEISLLCVIWDITEIELAREEAEEGRRTLEALMNYIPEGITIADAPDVQIRMMSNYGWNLIGLSLEEIVGRPRSEWWKLYCPVDGTLASIEKMPLSRVIGNGETITDEEWLLENARGEKIPILCNAGPIRNRKGEIVGGISAWRGIADRKRAEAALQESEERYRVLVDAISNVVWRTTPDGKTLLSLDGEGIIDPLRPGEQSSFRLDRFHPDDQPTTDEAWRLAIESKSLYDIEHRHLGNDGGYHWYRSRAVPRFDATGEVIEWIGISTDITDRKKAEQAIQEYSEQLEARVKERTEELVNLQRRLIENIEAERLWVSQELHDGPMQEIYGVLYHLAALKDYPNDFDWQAKITSFQDNLKQINENLRKVARELRPTSLTPFGLEKAIREHGERFDQEYQEMDISLDLMPDGKLLPEHMRLTLFRIYQTALTNAIRHAQAKHISVRFSYDDRDVLLEIQDDGKGFEVPKRIRTLARQGHFGLAGAVERAEAIGGKLEVESTPGKGTRLRVLAPLRKEGEFSTSFPS